MRCRKRETFRCYNPGTVPLAADLRSLLPLPSSTSISPQELEIGAATEGPAADIVWVHIENARFE
jgi:hypothetical protein